MVEGFRPVMVITGASVSLGEVDVAGVELLMLALNDAVEQSPVAVVGAPLLI